MIDLIGIFILLGLFGNLLLGLQVYLKAPHSRPNLSFLWAIITVILWCGTIFLYRISPSTLALFWAKSLYASAALIPVAFFIFAEYFPDSKPNTLRIYLYFFCSIVFALLCFVPELFIKNILLPEKGERMIQWGNYYILYVLYQNVFFGTYFTTLFQKLRRYQGVKKNQIRFVFAGTLLSVSGAFITNLFLPTFGIFTLNWLGQVLTVVWVGFVTYAIVKHRLMDIRIAIRKGIATLVISASMLAFYLLSYMLYLLWSGKLLSYDAIYAIVFVAIFTTLVFNHVSYLIQSITNKYLFSGIYNSSQLLKDLSTELNSTYGFSEALENIAAILRQQMHIKNTTFLLKLKKREKILMKGIDASDYVVYQYGDFMNPININTQSSKLFSRLSGTSLMLEEVKNSEMEESEMLYEWMVENQLEIILPLKIKNEIIGAVLLSEKLSGEAFSSEDVQLLETFALQAAIGIENILLFMHSRDFGERLKVEVEHATLELQKKNKNLEILQHMDSIIMNTLDVKEMCQKIVDTISWELGYEGALISLVDEEKQIIIPTAVSNTPKIKEALKILPLQMEKFVTSLNDKSSMSVQALALKGKITTTKLSEAFNPALPETISEGLQRLVGMKGVIVYPIFGKDRPLAVLTLAMYVNPKDVSSEEHNILDAFMEEVGIALENASLYEESRRMYQELYNSNIRLISLDRMKDEFVSVASHELRTPMTAINGYLWMVLQGRGGPLTERQRYYLERVQQSTQRLINLVNDMLSVSRIEGGRIQYNFKLFDILEIIKSVHEELQIKADEKKIKLIFNPSAASLLAFADPEKVREIVTNLIGNALKFTEKGSITTTAYKENGRVYVSVIDTGKGIAKEDMPRLFQKFGRLQNSYSTVAETTGTGLGLYICRKYIESMGGAISVQSEAGSGSTFKFYVPSKEKQK